MGISAGLKGELIYSDGEKFECEASAQAYATLGVQYGLSGKLFDCYEDPTVDGCFTPAEFTVDLTAFCSTWDYGLKISHTWELWDGTCDD